MASVYNTAIRYLQGKYGKRCGFTSAYNSEMRKIYKAKDRREREKNLTDKDYEIIIQPDLIDKDSNDWVIWLLVNQYNQLSSKPKQELENNLRLNGLYNGE